MTIEPQTNRTLPRMAYQLTTKPRIPGPLPTGAEEADWLLVHELKDLPNGDIGVLMRQVGPVGDEELLGGVAVTVVLALLQYMEPQLCGDFVQATAEALAALRWARNPCGEPSCVRCGSD
jgi:hypothetical protein